MNINQIEKKIFGINSRFNLTENQTRELKLDLNKSIILVTGAAGSIGKAFIQGLKKFKFKKVFLLDNNENALADLSRDINLSFAKKQIKDIDFICEDINNFNLKIFLKKNKISHFINFAALKHVRSEENFYSTKNIFKTNLISPFRLGNLKRQKYLKKIFFISTDKAANPSSLMGCSKKFMEKKLYELKNSNKKIFVSTVRFANVAFSNGSLLQNIFNRVKNNEIFGVPSQVYRYFISHEEASHLCFKSLLKESDGFIILPTYQSLGNPISLKFLAKRIVALMNKKPVFLNKIKKVKKNQQLIVETKGSIVGQKTGEQLYEKSEKLLPFSKDRKIKKIKLHKNHNLKFYEIKLMNSKNLREIRKICMNAFSTYKGVNKKNNIFLKNTI